MPSDPQKEVLTPTFSREYTGEGVEPSAQSIEYSRNQGKRKRTWPLRAAAILAVAAAGLLGFSTVPSLWHHFQLYWWQQQSLNSQRPSQLIWFSADNPLISPAYQGFWTAQSTLQPWTSGSWVFAGKMQNSSGIERFVLVKAHFSNCVIATNVCERAGLIHDPKVVDVSAFVMPQTYEYQFATIDTADPSHLVIPIRANGIEYTLDGWLKQNDQLTYQWRGVDPTPDVSFSPPLVHPAPPATSHRMP